MKRIHLYLVCVLVLLVSCDSAKEQARRQFIADSIAHVEAKEAAERNHKNMLARMRLDSLKRVYHADSIAHSIKILRYYISSPNSAGGIDAHFTYKNLNNKTIKYLTWIGYPINAVGDPVTCSIRGHSSFRGRDTGPIKKGQTSGSGYWDCAWYNYQAEKLILTGIEIEYMDGTTFTIKGDDLYLIGKKR